MARVGWTPSAAFTLGVLGYYGPEQAGNDDDTRQGVNVVATFKGISKTTIVTQFDYGTEEGLAADGGSASWWGVGGWLILDLGARSQLALRGDYVDDKDGVRTSGVFGFQPAASRQFGSVTATYNWRLLPKILIRPEVRVDFSSEDDFGELEDPTTTNPSIGLGVSYQF
jgi:hypothetical protein